MLSNLAIKWLYYNTDWEYWNNVQKYKCIHYVGNWFLAHAEENAEERSVYKSRPSCLKQHTIQSKDGEHSIKYRLETSRHLMGWEMWLEAQRLSLW